MKIIIGPRRSGKTAELIRLAAENFSYIITSIHADAQRIAQRARDMNLNIPLPITLDECLRGQYHAPGIKGGFMIDNLDRCIQTVTSVEIRAITLSSPTEEVGK